MTKTPPSDRQARRVAAMREEMQRVMRRLYSLSAAMMRADAAWEAYHREMSAVVAEGLTEDELVASATAQVARVENTALTRATESMTIWLALVYVVIEGWRKWNFFDPAVDRLLGNEEFVKELQGHRHAIFHANEFDDARVMRMTATPERTQWQGAVANALRAALRDWNTHLSDRLDEYLMRSSL